MLLIFVGPTRRFKRLCENLQTALLNCQSISAACIKSNPSDSISPSPVTNNGCNVDDTNSQLSYLSKDCVFKYPSNQTSNTSLISVSSKSGDSQTSSKPSSTPPKRDNSTGVPLTDASSGQNNKTKRLSVTSISAVHSCNRSNSVEKSSFSSSNSSSSLALLNNEDEVIFIIYPHASISLTSCIFGKILYQRVNLFKFS